MSGFAIKRMASLGSLRNLRFVKEGTTTVGFVTDLEGNWDYWNRYIEFSRILSRNANGELTLKDNCCFVHGGDVVDRGNGDIRILRDLVTLHKNYPSRVFFIVGNRDVNKLRLLFSLHPTVLQYKPQAFWIPESQTPEKLSTPIEKLKWMLKSTMGCPFTFECRRQELQELHRPSADQDVYDSFVNLIHPTHSENWLFQYLRRGRMSVILGDTMFVHGAINDAFRLGYVPRSKDNKSGEWIPAQTCPEPVGWTKLINEFMQNELDDYEKSLEEHKQRLDRCSSWSELESLLWDIGGDYDSPQPGSRLIQCGMGSMRDKSTNPGVIYASYLQNGKPKRIEASVRDWLQRSNPNCLIRNVIVGHQPNGDTPLVMDHLGVKTISADSSYSKLLQWRVKDLRAVFPAPPPPSSSSSSLSLQSEEDDSEEEYLTIEKFLSSKLGQPEPAPVTAADQANTRSEKAVNCLLLHYPAPVEQLLPPTNDLTAASKILLYGRVSLGGEYWSDLLEHQGLVGQETADGWWVKATDLVLNGQTYSVLAQSEGFTFRSKLAPLV